MLRLLVVLFSAIIGITILRSVIGTLIRFLAEFVNGPSSEGTAGPAVPSGGPRARAAVTPTELVACTVCGTFVPENNARSAVVQGKTYYYCSAACQSQHVHQVNA